MEDIKKIKLDALFSISTGIMDDGTSYYYKENGKEVGVEILRMSSFEPGKKIRYIDQAGKKGKQHSGPRKESKEIEKSRLLQATDYVICSRIGKLDNNVGFAGYSLTDSIIDILHEEVGPCVVSHNYIHLRPRIKDLEAMDINVHVPFLHLMMDVILEQLSISSTDPGSTTKILKVSYLKALSLRFPLHDFAYQKSECDKYYELNLEKRDIELKISNLQNKILNNLYID